MRYRRSLLKGGCYFFTLNLAQRDKSTLTEHIGLLRSSYLKVTSERPVETQAIVILPDHLHALWQLPENDCDYAQRWRQVKTHFSRNLPQTEHISTSRQRKGERGIWQRRYWEHQIRDEVDLQRHIDYIHFNPVKHGYVNTSSKWPYSSIHRYIKQGLITPNWGGGMSSDRNPAGFGEK